MPLIIFAQQIPPNSLIATPREVFLTLSSMVFSISGILDYGMSFPTVVPFSFRSGRLEVISEQVGPEFGERFGRKQH